MKELIEAARAVRANAHAPYSRYHVGAAVRAASGKIYVGANVENASYGLALCAERSAVAAAVSAGEKKLMAVAGMTSTSPPAAPCRVCRHGPAGIARHPLPIAAGHHARQPKHANPGRGLAPRLPP